MMNIPDLHITEYREIFCAALTGICANPAFFGPLFQQQPGAAVDFAFHCVRECQEARPLVAVTVNKSQP